VPRKVAAAIAKHGRNSVCTLLTAGVLPETDDISPDRLAEREDSAMGKEVWDLLDAGEGGTSRTHSATVKTSASLIAGTAG